MASETLKNERGKFLSDVLHQATFSKVQLGKISTVLE